MTTTEASADFPNMENEARSAAFLPFPSEVRQQIYEYLLVCQDHMILEFTRPGVPQDYIQRRGLRFNLHLSILRVDKATYADAVATLYAKNRIRLTYRYGDYPQCPSLDPFFEKIGSANALLMRHVCLALTAIVTETMVGDAWKLALEDDDEETIENIYEHCPNMRLRGVWCIPLEAGPIRPRLVRHWQEGAANLRLIEKRGCQCEEFVFSYCTSASRPEGCSFVR